MNNNYINKIKQKSTADKVKDNTQKLVTLDIPSYSMLQTFINSRECPHCGSHHVVGKGNYKGRKRYLCRDCGKSFNNLTNTPFSGIHDHDKVKIYLNCILNGYSIRKAAEIVEISINTSFIWRHKLLKSLERLPSPKMKNVKEVMELKLPYSHKGQNYKKKDKLTNSKVSVMFVCDRTGKLDSDSILYSNREENPVLHRILNSTNRHSELILHTKCKELHIPNISIIKSKSINSLYSNSNLIQFVVQNWHDWMKRFRGVATKYLSNYLHWFDFLDNCSNKQNKISSLTNLLLLSSHV